MKVAIIGASFAGVTAALEVRKKYPEAELVLLDKQAKLGYIPNGLHLYLDKKISSLNDAYFITEEELKSKSIDCLLEATVVNVDSAQKIIHYYKQNQKFMISYDKLIIATGSSQLSEKIIGSESDRVLTYKWHDEAEKALDTMRESKHLTIIGGGQIGVEIADLLRKNRKQVALVENMDYMLFKYFDKEMIQPLQTEMQAAGVDLYLNQTVSAIKESKNKLSIQLGNEKIASDAAILAVNVRPDLQFLDNRVERHMDHTIAVDKYLQTSAPDIFAVGDCIQLSFGSEGEDFYAPLINNAVRSGIAVANNLTKSTTPFNGSLRTIGTFAFGYYIASTGITESESTFSNHKIATKRESVPLNSLPNAPMVTLKYVYDKESHILLGVQLISKENVLERINTFALAIETKQTLEEMHQKEYFFHPSFTNIIETTNLVTQPNHGSDFYET